jgi:hypothetical protein
VHGDGVDDVGSQIQHLQVGQALAEIASDYFYFVRGEVETSDLAEHLLILEFTLEDHGEAESLGGIRTEIGLLGGGSGGEGGRLLVDVLAMEVEGAILFDELLDHTQYFGFLVFEGY